MNLAEDSVAVPSFTPDGGSYTKSARVTLRTDTVDATIRYTTDGTLPTAYSAIYTTPLELASSMTIQANAFKAGLAQSPVIAATFMVTTLGDTDARVTFLGADSHSHGKWKGVYGWDGYSVLGDSSSVPGYAQISGAGQIEYIWENSTPDPRALQRPVEAGRVAGTWYSSTSFTVDLEIADGKTHCIALYCVDWDRAGRVQTVELLDAGSGAVLNTQTLTEFTEGIYLLWDCKGHVRIRLTRVSGPNVVLAGLFFDPRVSPLDTQAVAPLLSSASNPLAAGADKFQMRLSGEASQQYVLETSTDLAVWTPVQTNTLASDQDGLVNLQAAGLPCQFYRARSLPAAENDYLIEASTDLLHWLPLGVKASDNLENVTTLESGTYTNRFYRATPLLPGASVVGLKPGPAANPLAR